MAFTGGCLCGAVRYEIRRRYLNAMHCHCGMCRKAHGTAFSTHALARPDQIIWVLGRDQLVPYESSPGAYREFCRRCGTHVLVHGQSGADVLGIPAGTLDGNPPLTVLGHMYCVSAVSWYRSSDDGLPRHPEWPPEGG